MVDFFATLLQGVNLKIRAAIGSSVNAHTITSAATGARTLGVPDTSGFVIQSRSTTGGQAQAFDQNVGFLTNMSVGRAVLINSDVPGQNQAVIPFASRVVFIRGFITVADAGQTLGLSVNGAAVSYTVDATALGDAAAIEVPGLDIPAGATLTTVGTGNAEGWISVLLGERIP